MMMKIYFKGGKMIEKIKKHKYYIFYEIEKMLKNKKPDQQLKKTKDQYLIACFLKIASKKDFLLLNCEFDDFGGIIKYGLSYDAMMIYVYTHLDKYINNEKYYNKYLSVKNM
jgi:hypothetical protein